MAPISMAVADREAAIISYFNDLMQETLVKHLEERDLDFEDLVELKDSHTIAENLVEDDVQLISEDSIECLKKLNREVNELIKDMKDYYDDELEELVKDLSKLIKDVLKENDLSNEGKVQIGEGCGFLEKNDRRDWSFLGRQAQRADVVAEEDFKHAAFRLKPEKCLQEFTSTFVKSIEDVFITTAKYLSEQPYSITLNATIEEGIKFCALIPKLKNISIIGKTLATLIGKSNIRKIATLPSGLIDYYARSEARIILIRAAYRIFSHFEYQFSLVPWSKFIYKLATDSATRYLYYLLRKGNVMEITSDDIVKGILQGKSAWNPNMLIGRGRILLINGKNLTTVDFFTKTGIRERKQDKIIYRANKDTLHEELKYRLVFPHEDVLTYDVVPYDDKYDYKYTEKNEKQEIEALCKHIDPDYVFKDPEDSNGQNKKCSVM